MKNRWMIPCIYLHAEKAVTGFGQRNLFGSGDVEALARFYSESGADRILVFDFSRGDAEHDRAISMIRMICEVSKLPVYAAGNVKRLEDVKKLIYAGCSGVALNFSKEENIAILPEASKRFGKDRMIACVSAANEFTENRELIETHAFCVLELESLEKTIAQVSSIPVIAHTDVRTAEKLMSLLKEENVEGLSGDFISRTDTDIAAFKAQCREAGIEVSLSESALPWSEFKLNGDGLIPVVVQDYRNDEVLMVAYMNQEAFETTVRTGRMTYYSRSRQELWVKGLTSGHFQYVKSLSIDCDNDTILAKVDQIGAACHTGNRSCFYRPLLTKAADDAMNPLRVFQNVYDVIQDRKLHPKEGSYTNYLFDKGLDKILKKVGEEATEIVIAAKNPDKEEIKYEISDFLYHMMVLMAEKGVSWEDITEELARR